jgi:HEAT repeat protein
MDPRAGLEAAERWMHSDDFEVRVSAVDVFRDVGDATALRRLQVLATDSDSRVVNSATIALQGLARR